MRLIRTVGSLAVLAGMVLTAQDGFWDTRTERRDVHHDYARAEKLRDHIARDQWRMDEDLRRGNRRAAEHQARDIAKDERKLDRQMQDIRRDERGHYGYR